MKKFYFTFGTAHHTLDGQPMADYWVTVSAPDYGAAREHFCTFFAKPIMGMSSRWAFQYEEGEFHGSYFPSGEYKHLIVPEKDLVIN